MWLAPGFLIRGTGLVLCRQGIAHPGNLRNRFWHPAGAFTAGHDRQELEKRIASDLIQAAPVLFLDNVNGAVLRSDTLATLTTERPARLRVFGELRMAVLNNTAFIAITGNGLTVSEDLARRFIDCKLDAATKTLRAGPSIRATLRGSSNSGLSCCRPLW